MIQEYTEGTNKKDLFFWRMRPNISRRKNDKLKIKVWTIYNNILVEDQLSPSYTSHASPHELLDQFLKKKTVTSFIDRQQNYNRTAQAILSMGGPSSLLIKVRGRKCPPLIETSACVGQSLSFAYSKEGIQ